jgi:hypothetical protein
LETRREAWGVRSELRRKRGSECRIAAGISPLGFRGIFKMEVVLFAPYPIF